MQDVYDERRAVFKRIKNYPWDRKTTKEVKKGCRAPHKIGMIYIQMPAECIGKKYQIFLKEVSGL